MKVGDIVMTAQGEGRIVRGSNHAKPPARGGHWVYLFFPPNIQNRVILYRPCELRLREAGERGGPQPLQMRPTVKVKKSRKARKNYTVTVLAPGTPSGVSGKRQRQLAKQGYRPSWRPA
jgi:hypothetical protein